MRPSCPRPSRKLVSIIQQVRDLDLKKPPSIAESIDWARALLLLGADDISPEIFRETMSIIVKHRTDLDTVADASACGSARPPRREHGLRRARSRAGRGAARRGRRDRHVRAQRRVRRARRGPVDRGRRLPRHARRDARQVARGPAHLRPRVRPLLLPRDRGGGDPPGRARGRDPGRGRGRHHRRRPDRARQPARAAAAGDPRRQRAAMRDLARLAIAAFGRRGRAPAARPASMCSGSAVRSACARSPAVRCRTPGRPSRASRASRSAGSSRTCGASSNARRWSARSRFRPRGR